ncbi:MAG: ATP-binding cassette subfamily B protein RaxB [Gammaproteobacteria bacterium]|jgi:ATP-binding cassette subfamily B protein RaxB
MSAHASKTEHTSKHWFSKLRFMWLTKVELVMQAEASECGLACLCMVSSYFGKHVLLRQLRAIMPASQQGLSMHQLIDYGRTLGLSSRALKLELEELSQLQCPAILHWNFSHFVVLTKVTRRYVHISDPAVGERKLSWLHASKSFTGVALELMPNNDFRHNSKPNTLSLWDFAKPIKGIKQQLGFLIALSLLIQVFVLASPFYMQTVVDKILLTSSESLLFVLALGFGLLLLIECATQWLREVVLLRFSNTFNLHISSSVLAHLLSLPLAYFQRRHMGDIVSRFGSLQPVRDTLTQGLVAALIDGILSIATLVVMLMYSTTLTLIVIAIVVLYSLGRWALFYPIKHLNQQILHSDAKQQSFFMQSIRAARTIKLANTAASTQAKWLNLFIDNINQRIKLGQWNIGFSIGNKVLFGIENIVVVYVAATLVMANEFSVGMLFAFMSYKSRFIGSSIGLIEIWIEYKLLNVHLARIEDIVHQAPEVSNDSAAIVSTNSQAQLTKLRSTQQCGANISVNHIGFRYHSNQPWIFDKLSIQIKSGEYIAIVGASGCGKTSLLHCLLGLLTPNKGKMTFNTAPFSPQSRQHHRIAAVMQDDQLLSGSIIDNISQFAERVDIERVIEVAKLACIDADIMSMTMQYQTLIGDMGDSLSGGQKQRVLLARALYQRPDLLVLDEATSHLDVSTEAQVCKHLKNLNTTIIMVAHRPQTIATANKVYALSNDGLTEISYSLDNLPSTTNPILIQT